MRKPEVFIFIFLLVVSGCKDRYDLPLRPSDQSSLVVDGFLNGGQGSTTIILSRVLNLKDPAAFKPELKAKVSVEGKDNSSYTLTEAGNGRYTINQIPLVIGKEYRLRIKTSNGKEYQSDYIMAKKTPPIDSISWKKENEGIRIYANTHDATNNTKYYRWDYDETWEIHSYYDAMYKWVSDATIILMPSNERTFACWKYLSSNVILVRSSTQLQTDIISEAPLLHIPANSEKLSVRYSILVKQYALTKEAYEFLQLMKKNTESLGTIFDAQPSELRGNIHCLNDPQELVIGFLSASSVEEKRIFITNGEAGGTFRMFCEEKLITNNPDTIRAFMPAYLPVSLINDPVTMVEKYVVSSATCVDCRTRGGLLAKPSFW